MTRPANGTDTTASDKAGAIRSAGRSGKDLIDFTPEPGTRRHARSSLYRSGPLFTPPSVRTETVLGTLQLPGNQGSALWQGAVDPETNMLYVPSVSNMTVQAFNQAAHGRT